MPRSDRLEALLVDSDTAFVLDRRRRHISNVSSTGALSLHTIAKLTSSMDGTDVFAGVFKHPILCAGVQFGTTEFPKRLSVGGMHYRRLVDRFYLPETTDPVVSAALFDLIAAAYDDLITRPLNLHVAAELLKAVLCTDGSAGSRDRILDFGCGTGIAVNALNEVNLSGHVVEIVGTDISSEMLKAAAKKGEATIAFDAWRNLPNECWDGVIAAFVLHYGVPVSDLKRIAAQLKPGRRMATNFFKADPGSIRTFIGSLEPLGLRFDRMAELSSEGATPNPMLVFTKVSP